MDIPAEWTLIERCRAGSTAAFEPLVRQYEGPARVLAEALLQDPDDAADAVQDAFVRAYRTLDRLEAGSGFGPWFRTILRNRCLDTLRASRRHGQVTLDHPEASASFRVEPTAADALERAEFASAVHGLLAGLGPAQREILVLKEMEGMSYAELAGALGVPEGTVASRLHHARTALRRALERANAAGTAP